ncbi:hypothetical protein H8E77_03920 [bacterium]|nr:hypothetical protein [bacterium]
MTAIPSQLSYVIDRSGIRTHVIIPVELFEQLIQEEPSSEDVFVDIEEAEHWLSTGLPETLEFTGDTIYNIKGCKSNAPADLSECLDDYLYERKCKE